MASDLAAMNGPANDEPGHRGSSAGPWLTSDTSGTETAVAFVAYQAGGTAGIPGL